MLAVQQVQQCRFEMHWRNSFVYVLDRHTSLVHEPLIKIPCHADAVPQTVRQRFLQHSEDWVCVRSIDVGLSHEIETLRYVKSRVNEGFYLVVRWELLMKLIARKCQYWDLVSSMKLL